MNAVTRLDWRAVRRPWLVPLFAIVASQIGIAQALSTGTRVTVNGIGAIKVGMTVQQAQRASGLTLARGQRPVRPDDGACYYVSARTGLDDVLFMIEDGTVARVDVRNRAVRTLSGAHIGQTEAEVQRIYGRDLEVTPHKYDDKGHYLTVYPNSQRRVIFETDGKVVKTFRAGRMPAVGYVEGCA